MNKPKYYITTAIPYASGKPHIGNTYEIILTDAIARYKRARGYDVYFLTGTDEHGQKVETLAAKKGVTEKAYVDEVVDGIKRVYERLNCRYDGFIRTTDAVHEAAIQKIFKKLYERDDIYKGEYDGWYCVPCETFYTNSQLVDGKCPDCGREVTHAKEEAYFLRLSKYADRLLRHIEENPDFITPESSKKEMINNFILPGLRDVCVSRTSIKWGVPVDFDPGHVIYVWIDALSNYITALGYAPDKKGELYKKYWPCDLHVIGKDIVRFHTTIWPIILMALGEPLPKQVYGHGWLLFGAEKMSKSRGNVLYADELADIFGTDGVRYCVLAEAPYAADGNITYETIIGRYNTDLANNFGNLLSRTHSMTKKYFGGVVPKGGTPDELDRELAALSERTVAEFKTAFDGLKIADAVERVTVLLSRANKYIDETAPWNLFKTAEGKLRLQSVIYNLLEVIRVAAVLLHPIMPSACEEVFAQLGTDKTAYESIEKFGGLVEGTPLGEGKILFARIDEVELMKSVLAKREEKKTPPPPVPIETAYAPLQPQISIDDFMKTDLRTAQVLACEPVKGAKKLLKLTVDLGFETRTVVSGIAKFYTPEQLVGKKIIVVANLAPATLCGIESRGMLLASGEDPIRVVFLSDDTPLGRRVR